MDESSPRTGLSARDIIKVVFKQKKIFTSIVAFTTILVLLGVYVLPLPHKAEAKIYVDRNKMNTVPGISQYGIRYLEREEILNTEVEVILSRPVAEKVVDQLALDKPHSDETIFNSIGDFLGGITSLTGLVNEVSLRAAAINSVQGKIKVKPVPKSNVIDISYLGSDPEKITNIVNAVADAYIETRRELHKPRGLRSFYAAQATLFKNELDVLNERDHALRSQWSVNRLELERQSVVTELSVLKKGFLEKNEEYVSVDLRIGDMKRSGNYTPFDNNVMRYLAIDQMGGRLLDLQLSRNKLVQMYKPGNPRISNIEAEITALKGNILKSLESIRSELKSRVSGFERKINLLDKEKGTLNDQESILDEIATAAQVAEKYYLNYKGLEEQARLSDISDSEGLNVVILSYATQPEAPIFPRFIFIVVGFIFSIFTAYGIALLLEYFNHVVDTPEDIEYFSGLRVVAVIPEIDMTSSADTAR